MFVCRRVCLRLLQDSIELFPALNHPPSHCPHKRTRNLHTPMLFHIHYSVDSLNTYIHILHTRISDKNKVKNLVVMICMHACMYVRMSDSNRIWNTTQPTVCRATIQGLRGSRPAEPPPSHRPLLSSSALVVPWYPRSSEIGTVPASVGFAELEVIDENSCVHHGPTSFSRHEEHAAGVDSLVGRCEWRTAISASKFSAR
jgi:hypothetical protein